MRKLLLLLLLTALLLCACAGQSAAGSAVPEGVDILLTGEGARIACGGVKAEGGAVTVSAVGRYVVSGSLRDGHIVVDTGEDAVDVTLVLSGADITCADGPAIWVRQAKNVYLELAQGTENRLCSGTEADLAAFDDSRSGAALYSEDDLILRGGGSLAVLGHLNNGITCKDDLRIEGGTLRVTAANNGIRATETLELAGGEVSVSAGNDGLKTSSSEKEGKGWILISGGSLAVECGGDGISAVTDLRAEGGSVRVNTLGLPGGGSCKGLKAGGSLSVTDGSIAVTAPDDGLHADGDLRIEGGTLRVTAVTGLQAGIKDSGEGSVLLSGGSVSIFAEKQAVKFEENFSADCRLLALYGSGKQGTPHAGGQAYLLAELSGRAGELVRIGDREESAERDFSALLYTDEELTAGESYEILVGERSIRAVAR